MKTYNMHKSTAKPKSSSKKSFDLSFITKQPKYVLYGSGLILLGVILLITGILLL